MAHELPAQRLAALPELAVGLSDDEAAQRLAQYGPNDILSDTGHGWLALLLETAKDPMLWFLLGTSALYGFLGDRQEALVLLAALVPFLAMDGWLHRRTQASTASLAGQLASSARVLRAGHERVIPATAIVPGDIVLLGPADALPADGVFIEADELKVDESALTGEAFPVRKSAEPPHALPWQRSVDDAVWGNAGTRVLTGSGRLLVVRTGAETSYGGIVRMALAGGAARTPLQQAIDRLVRVLLLFAGTLCLALAAIRLWQGHGLVDALLSAVTLAVAALPEEFPIVFTVFLGVGVYRLAGDKALVRRAAVVENIGRISTIATDKTGTLTEGRLELAHQHAAAGVSEASLLAIARAASRTESQDPLDTALLADAPLTEGQVLASFPFTEDRKREVALWRRRDGCCCAAMKGAPETVLALCDLPEPERQHWQDQVTALANDGHKVIACADQALPALFATDHEPANGFRFAGLIAFEDPIRPGVREATALCREAGIHVLMVTGDHPGTAAAITRELAPERANPVVIDAAEAERRLAENPGSLREIDAIARALPAQKLQLVEALKASGELVAVTGDGVNDVPALKAADVGIAMGERGTRAAREVAAIVLLDDNFASIVRAIAEGQQLFRNLKDSFAYLLLIHLPLVLSAALVPLAGGPILYLPIHIIWLELIIHPSALLAFQARPTGSRLAPARRERRLAFFDRSEWVRIAVASALMSALLLGAYVHGLGASDDVLHARSQVILLLGLFSALCTAALSRLATRTARLICLGTLVQLAVLLQTPALAQLLHVTPLTHGDWALAAIALLTVGAVLSTGLGKAQRRQDADPTPR